MASLEVEADSSSQDRFDTMNSNDCSNYNDGVVEANLLVNALKERAEEELDFEEGSVDSGDKVECADVNDDVEEQKLVENECKQDLDEGQVNSEDDDLEEGEVVDDDDDEPTPGQRERSPCRFFGKGQCTWGDSCRFSHDLPSPNKQIPASTTPMGPLPQKIPFEPLPLPPMPLYAHPGLLQPPPIPHPHMQRPVQESGWERGIKTARERIVRANERKEKDVDFNEKRLNMSVEDDDGYRSSKHHYSSREEYYSSHDRRSPHGSHSSSSLYSKYAEQYYSESRGSRYQDTAPRDERYSRERRDRESEYERRQRLALESAPKEWQEDRRRQYDYARSTTRNPDIRRPDDYPADAYRRSPNPRTHHDGNRSPYSSFSDTSGSGLSSSEFSDSDSDSWSDHGEPKERTKKRKDYKTKSYSSTAVAKPVAGAAPNPLSKRIPKISQRNRPEDPSVAAHHPPRSSYPYDDRADDRYDPERDRRHRQTGDTYVRSRSRSQKGTSLSPEIDRSIRPSREEGDAPYRKKRRSGQSPPAETVATKEPSFSMNMKSKSRATITSKPFSESGDEDDGRNVLSPKDENSLSPGFEQLSPKQQIAHLSARPDPSQRRKALLEQLRAVEAAIAKKKKA